MAAQIISLAEYRLGILATELAKREERYKEIIESNQKDIVEVSQLSQEMERIRNTITHFEEIKSKEAV